MYAKLLTMVNPILLAPIIALFLFFPESSVAEIKVPDTVKQNQPIVATIKPTAVPDGAKIRGSITVSKASYLPAAEKGNFHIWAAPGKHTITATGVWVQTKDIKIGDQTVPVLVDFGQYNESKDFVVEGKENPDPNPGPDPGPIPKNRWIAILEETGDRTVELNQKVAALRKGLSTETLLILDRNQQGASLASIINQVKAFPSFVVLDGEGKILYKGPVPTVAEAQQILGGKK